MFQRYTKMKEFPFQNGLMEYNDYHNIHELSDDLPFGLKHIHDYSDYVVNGQHCAQTFSTMHKIQLFISWMSRRKKENTFQISPFPYISGFQ